MFGWEFPPRHSGGLGVACEGLVRGLRKHGVDISLVLPSPVATDHAKTVRTPEDASKAFLTRLEVPSLLDPYDTEETYLLHAVAGATQRETEIYGPNLSAAVDRYTATAVEITKDLHPDVIHCHDWMTYDAGIKAREYHDVPVVAHVHATEVDRTHFHPNPRIFDREHRGLHAADAVLAVSDYTKNIVTTHYGVPAQKIHVVHNGHDPVAAQRVRHLLHEKSAAPVVLFLGRMTVQKNPYQFLNIASVVHTHRPDARFVMAGDGPMLPQLIERACDMGLSDVMLFTGKVNEREARHLYASADCFVMPSLSEPFGLVALEALAQGTPVIVSRQSGVAEVLDHAFKVDYWDTDLMADCLLTILREEPLARQLRSEAPKALRKLRWEDQAAKVQSLYHSVIHD